MGRRKTRKLARSAKTGEFVTFEYAKRHPSTTVVETVPVRKRSNVRQEANPAVDSVARPLPPNYLMPKLV